MANSKVLGKKRERGFLKFIATKSFTIVQWEDNIVVCLESNFEGMEFMGQANRWSLGEKKIDWPQPALVDSYKRNMRV